MSFSFATKLTPDLSRLEGMSKLIVYFSLYSLLVIRCGILLGFERVLGNATDLRLCTWSTQSLFGIGRQRSHAVHIANSSQCQ